MLYANDLTISAKNYIATDMNKRIAGTSKYENLNTIVNFGS